MSLIETLAAERDITRALTSFARAMDNRDWDGLAALIDENATGDLGTGPLNNRDAIIAVMRAFLDDCGPTQHLLGNILIDVNGDEAHSRAYVSDMHLGKSEETRSRSFSTLGDYEDRWKKIAGRWIMVHRTKHNRALIGDISVLGTGPQNWQEKDKD